MILMGLLGFVLAYLLGSRALDTGSIGQYLITLIILVLSVRLLRRAFAGK